MRNIVLITLDSLRADHCSCYGYQNETTPFLKELTKKGIKFENCIVTGVPTQPSSFGMVTSEHLPSHPPKGPSGWKSLIKNKETIFKVLSKEYRTGVFTPHPFFSSYFGVTKGCSYERSDFLKQASKQEKIRNSLDPIFSKLGIIKEASLLNNILRGEVNIARIDTYYENIINFVRKSKKPYFVWIFSVDTHIPFLPPKSFSKDLNRRRAVWSSYKAMKDKKLSVKELKLLKKAYDAEIKYADYFIKQLWEGLEDTNPVFIINADHGEAFGEHGFYNHPQKHYEYLIRVPMIVYNYNGQVSETVKEPISMIRLAPTLCDIAGIRNNFENPSLLEDTSYNPPIIDNYQKISVRDAEWKLITNPELKDELYNIKKDPSEKQNLIDDEPDITKELREIVEEHKKRKKHKEDREMLKNKISNSITDKKL